MRTIDNTPKLESSVGKMRIEIREGNEKREAFTSRLSDDYPATEILDYCYEGNGDVVYHDYVN